MHSGKNCGVERLLSQVKSVTAPRRLTLFKSLLLHGLGNCTKQNRNGSVILHAQSTLGLFSISIKLRLLSLENFMQRIFNYKLPSWEFEWIFISVHGELIGQNSFRLMEIISEWGLLKPLVVVRTTHIA